MIDVDVDILFHTASRSHERAPRLFRWEESSEIITFQFCRTRRARSSFLSDHAFSWLSIRRFSVPVPASYSPPINISRFRIYGRYMYIIAAVLIWKARHVDHHNYDTLYARTHILHIKHVIRDCINTVLYQNFSPLFKSNAVNR